MDIAHTTLNVLNWLALNIPWDLVVASGILSPLALGFKKWRDVQSEKVMMTIVLVLGVAGAAATYLLNTPTTDPSIIAVRGLMIAAMSQPWYFLVYKPAVKWLSAELAKARAFDAEVRSAAIPAEGLPVTQTK